MNKKKINNYIDILDKKINLNKESKKVNFKKIFNAKKKDKKKDELIKIIYEKKIK